MEHGAVAMNTFDAYMEAVGSPMPILEKAKDALDHAISEMGYAR